MVEFSYFLKKYFVASHIHNGENIHGHNFLCIGEFELGNTEKIKEEFKNALKTINYKVLNEIDFFKVKTPSTENIALYISEILNEKIKVKKIEVYETLNFSGGVKQ